MRFATLIKDAQSFLSDLSQNNTRAWFIENKPRYEDQLKTPALALLDTLSGPLDEMTGTRPTTKLFRPNRDIRFSKDKTPYHTHLHIGWTTPGSPQPIGWFFGISPSYISVGAGLMGFDKPTLTAWRNTVAGETGTPLAQDIAKLVAQGFRLSDPELKRVPAPFDKDHLRADLLRRKSLTVWRDFKASEMNDPPKVIADTFHHLHPLAAKLADLA